VDVWQECGAFGAVQTSYIRVVIRETHAILPKLREIEFYQSDGGWAPHHGPRYPQRSGQWHSFPVEWIADTFGFGNHSLATDSDSSTIWSESYLNATMEDFHITFRTFDLSQDVVTILDTCGRGLGTEFSFSEPTRLEGAGSVQHFIASSLSRWVWGGGARLRAPGGDYRLCWCAKGWSCSISEDFAVDIGSLLVLGPSPRNQEFTCVSGRSCKINGLSGVGVADGALLILDTCHTVSPVPKLANEGGSELVSTSGTTSHGSSWGSAPFSAAGGAYRIC
jgi:hypothetical protein